MQRNHEAGRFSIQLWARVLAAPAIRVDPEVPHAHDAGERLERNLDPSRASAPGDADTPVAGRDGPTVLPGFAGDGSWRSVVAGAGLGYGTSDRNSAARDHSADRSRTPRGIPRRSKPVAGESRRQEWPCPPADGTRQRQTIMSG